ncbi:UPF0012 hydrolase C26A3.11 [Taphrina deformans PYCC 5710]|uniref:UPF0012 hydrolase C26A3.11 n=1 Tax=Taphrina deformans (strain PYCC 5710 / ATCC 11124 / CBS 356.35 / IMI 108563 / JCM 9778 / NBRC 8474) TaxID=1097556 RepID=R4XAF3_TAPDE|nr:UPF0012 hydrolase C26A3.11 [Taphrina deformans PYCC 5710]|eukprot:CCG82742.1 UPF0012 hydrolase C26A3.11 [Taphrina deformans PYCC 5710]
MSLAPKGFKSFRLGLIQLATGANKSTNLRNAAAKVKEAAQGLAQVVVLPECFNSPYGTQYFKEYSETIEPPGESFKALSGMAKDNNIYLVGGSIPEERNGSLYNTSLSFDNKGQLIGVHRKVHLFDIDVPGKIKFQESECLSPGNSLTEIETPYGKLGIAICYDIRFPEMAMIAARNGCCAMIYPGAFNLTTGPLHWELLGRARAIDNQIYVALCSPARDMTATYHAWGNSTIVNPNGEVIAKAAIDQEIIYADCDPDSMAEMRLGIPVVTQRRFQVYSEVKAL